MTSFITALPPNCPHNCSQHHITKHWRRLMTPDEALFSITTVKFQHMHHADISYHSSGSVIIRVVSAGEKCVTLEWKIFHICIVISNANDASHEWRCVYRILYIYVVWIVNDCVLYHFLFIRINWLNYMYVWKDSFLLLFTINNNIEESIQRTRKK